MQKDERVERARQIAEHPHGNTAATAWQAMRDVIAAYNDLTDRREQDIREAVEVEQSGIVDGIEGRRQALIQHGHVEQANLISEIQTWIERRGRETDPATIRRDERERTIEDCVEVAAKRFEQYLDNVEKYHLWAVVDVINDVIVNPLRSLTAPRTEAEVCEWRRVPNDVGYDGWRTRCRHFVLAVGDLPTAFISCPYCSCPIRIVEKPNAKQS